MKSLPRGTNTDSCNDKAMWNVKRRLYCGILNVYLMKLGFDSGVLVTNESHSC